MGPPGMLKLRKPAPRHDVVELLENFESSEKARNRNLDRSRSLRRLAKAIERGQHRALMSADERIELLTLADDLADERGAPTSPACAIALRRTRRRLTGELLRLHESVEGQAVTFTIVGPLWRTPARDLMGIDAARLKASLRSALNRAGADPARGAVVAALESDPGNMECRILNKYIECLFEAIAA